MSSKVAIAEAIEGGCLCGRLRYRAGPAEGDSAYCHCRMCQRASGAPAVAWVSIPASKFVYAKGAPAIFRSSVKGQREFCGLCGTQLLFRGDGAGTCDINTCTLDDPTLAPPQYHIWRMSRVAWFETADDLPRYEERGADV